MSSFSSLLGDVLSAKAPNQQTPYESAVANFPKAVREYVRRLEGVGRESDFIRASGAYYLCPRQFVLNYWRPVIEEQVNFENCLFMDVGTMMHAYLQDGLLGPCGVLIGHWQHKETREIVEGVYPGEFKSLRDFRDSPNEWVYVEPKVWHEGWRISGHCDGICDELRLQAFVEEVFAGRTPQEIAKKLRGMPVSGKRVLLEIKTCNSRIAEQLVSSKDISDAYKTQATVYQTLTGIDSTVFWYFSRDSFATKAFIYKGEPARFRDVERKAEIIWTAIRDEALPTSAMPCASHKDARAQKCAVADRCWKMDLPFPEFVKQSKELQPSRKWLDLTSWQPPTSCTASVSASSIPLSLSPSEAGGSPSSLSQSSL